MRWVTCDVWHKSETWNEWHEIKTWDEWHEIETWDEWHEIEKWDEWLEMSEVMMKKEMSDMRWMTCDEWHVINWLWPYSFCEFLFLNPLVNPLLNPFLIVYGQAEWRNDETWDEWHEIETEMSERQPETVFLSFWAGGRCRVGISYCYRGWAEVTGNIMRWLECRGFEQKWNVATREYLGSNLTSVT